MGEKELLDKKNSRIKRLPNNASLGRTSFVEDIHSSADRSIDKKTRQKLSARSIIDQKLTLMISGKTGSSGTHTAGASDNCAFHHGHIVRYFRAETKSLETCPDASGFAVRISRNTQTGARESKPVCRRLLLN